MSDLLASTNIRKLDFSQIEQEQAKAAEAKAAKVGKEKPIRSTVDLSRAMHKEVKIKTAEQGITLRDYMINLIEQDLRPVKEESDVQE